MSTPIEFLVKFDFPAYNSQYTVHLDRELPDTNYAVFCNFPVQISGVGCWWVTNKQVDQFTVNIEISAASGYSSIAHIYWDGKGFEV